MKWLEQLRSLAKTVPTMRSNEKWNGWSVIETLSVAMVKVRWKSFSCCSMETIRTSRLHSDVFFHQCGSKSFWAASGSCACVMKRMTCDMTLLLSGCLNCGDPINLRLLFEYSIETQSHFVSLFVQFRFHYWCTTKLLPSHLGKNFTTRQDSMNGWEKLRRAFQQSFVWNFVTSLEHNWFHSSSCNLRLNVVADFSESELCV